ncbi:MAG: helix-turn-helix domain-containing protein [Anaerolineae bacterium]
MSHRSRARCAVPGCSARACAQDTLCAFHRRLRATQRALAARPHAAPAEDAPPDTFVPHFGWVLACTGDPQLTLTYGVVWRYCRLPHGICYASLERMADDLGYSPRSLQRWMAELVRLGLVIDHTPAAQGVPHHYTAVSRADFYGSTGRPSSDATDDCQSSPPATSYHATDDCLSSPPTTASPTSDDCQSPPPATASRTRIESQDTKRIPGEDTRARAAPRASPAPGHAPPLECTGLPERPPGPPVLPALRAVEDLLGHRPPRVLWPRIRRTLGDQPDVACLRACYQAWCARGFRPTNLAWLFEWYPAGGPPRHTAPPHARQGAYRHEDPTQDANYDAWATFQRRVHAGEDPDHVRAELHL